MRHRSARALLPAVLDRTLPPTVEAAVRAHLEECAACAADLDELEACEQLLLHLPPALVPRHASAAAEARLGALARWAGVPVLGWPARLPFQAMGAFAAAFLLVMALSAGRWDPVLEERFETSPVSIAAVPRVEVTPYTWR